MNINDSASSELLISLPKAAKTLGVCERTVRRHFDLVRIGGAVRVRTADIQKKIDSKGLTNHVA